MSKKSKKSKAPDLRKLLEEKKKDGNPYRQFSRDPQPSDLKFENWQKAAKTFLKQDPDNPRKACWKAITLSDHSGSRNRRDDNYNTMHWSLLGAISNALLKNMIDPDLTDPNTEEFRDHILSQYDHDNPESQFQGAWDNCMKMTQEELYAKLSSEPEENDGSLKKAKFDFELLSRYDRTPIESFTEISPVSEEEMAKLDPVDIIKQMFPPKCREISNGNSKKSRKGFVAVGEKENLLPLIFDPEDEFVKHPYTGDSVENLDNYRYFSRSIFKESSTRKDGGGRTKMNVARDHLFVAEADFELYNGLPDTELSLIHI